MGCGELLHRAVVREPLRGARRLLGSALPLRSGVHWTQLLRQQHPEGGGGVSVTAQRERKEPAHPLPLPFPLQASLKERFDWEGTSGPQWQVLEGGRPCTDCGVLVEGTALYFGGADARQAVTADLDLRGAKLVLSRRFSPSILMDLAFL